MKYYVILDDSAPTAKTLEAVANMSKEMKANGIYEDITIIKFRDWIKLSPKERGEVKC